MRRKVLLKPELSRLKTPVKWGLVAIAVAIISSGVAVAAPNDFPLSVGSVTISPNPALRPAAVESISAPISVSFDSSSDTTNSPACTGGVSGGPDGALRKKNFTETVVTISDTLLSVSAADNASPQNSTSLSDGDNDGTFTGSLPTASPDGQYQVTVTATASETKNVKTYTYTSYYSDTSCSTFISSTTPVKTSDVTSHPSATASASATYVVDEQPPDYTYKPLDPSGTGLQGSGTVTEGNPVVVKMKVVGGSANTWFTFDVILTDPNMATTTSSFGPYKFGPGSDGIANAETHVLSILIPCGSALGDWTAQTVLHAVDLGGNPWGIDFDSIDQLADSNSNDDIVSSSLAFTVVPASVNLGSTTLILGEDATTHLYTSPESFTGGGTTNTSPGTFHIAQIVTPLGDCVGQLTLTYDKATLTIPADFLFMSTGKSPDVHIFIGTGDILDLHDPTLYGFTEVTQKPALTSVLNGDGTKSQVVDFTKLFPPSGTLNADVKVYMRAHNKYDNTKGVPTGTKTFTSSISATAVNGNPQPLTNSSSDTIQANP
jgi:hypothetical protein